MWFGATYHQIWPSLQTPPRRHLSLNFVINRGNLGFSSAWQAGCYCLRASVCFYIFLEPVVTAWQSGYESLLTSRLVPQLVAAEENRTSCQPSSRHPAFALHNAILQQRIVLHFSIHGVIAVACIWGVLCASVLMIKLLAIDLGG